MEDLTVAMIHEMIKRTRVAIDTGHVRRAQVILETLDEKITEYLS
jgi:hypothetical protein